MAYWLASLQTEQLEEFRKKPGAQVRATEAEEQVTHEEKTELQLTQLFPLRKNPEMQLRAVKEPEQVTKAGFA